MILLDTNLLTRLTSQAHPHGKVARESLEKLRGRGERLVIAPQSLYEFWAVATRAAGAPPTGHNGLGMTTDRASLWLRYFQRRFDLLVDREDLAVRWHELVVRYGIKGLRSHDARLVAAMESYGIGRILTFNADDFKVFSVTVIDPASV